MKTIGIIGGMSWESSAHYYTIINRAVRDALGPPHSARIVLHSLDFAEIAALQRAGDWDALGNIMAESARKLEAAGCDCILVATNTMHKLADRIGSACTIPLIHIVDPTAQAIRDTGLTRVGLLGTAFTMEGDFYRGRLSERFGLDVLVPDTRDRAQVHKIIYEELVAGNVQESSLAVYRDVIARLVERGAQGIILGCTEIMLLVSEEDSAVPLFDTTRLHAEAAASFALSD